MNENILWVNQKKRRYYRVRIYLDLLNDIVIAREWGSLDSNRGGSLNSILSDKNKCEEVLESISKKRKSRNYEIMNQP